MRNLRPWDALLVGLLLVLFDFRVGVVDVVPDPLGWPLVASGWWRLRPWLVPVAPALFLRAQAAAAASLALVTGAAALVALVPGPAVTVGLVLLDLTGSATLVVSMSWVLLRMARVRAQEVATVLTVATYASAVVAVGMLGLLLGGLLPSAVLVLAQLVATIALLWGGSRLRDAVG